MMATQSEDLMTMEEFVEMVNERGREGLMREYENIQSRLPEDTFMEATKPENMKKNRYKDVLCYDHSRVVLTLEDGDIHSDYINANFVDGYKQKNAYILTQGPLPQTCHDFWRMIWEQNCLVIVMTTRVLESGRVKCEQYWDLNENSSLKFGNFHVETLSIKPTKDFTKTSIKLRNLITKEERKISHWNFTSWPDYGVPSTPKDVLKFLRSVRQKQARMVEALGDTWPGHPKEPPIVVHCSAGIGRSGTFITLDICIMRLEDNGTVDIRETVEKIRQQRALAVQTPDQYVFCHFALIEYAKSRDMLELVSSSEIKTNIMDDE